MDPSRYSEPNKHVGMNMLPYIIRDSYSELLEDDNAARNLNFYYPNIPLEAYKDYKTIMETTFPRFKTFTIKGPQFGPYKMGVWPHRNNEKEIRTTSVTVNPKYGDKLLKFKESLGSNLQHIIRSILHTDVSVNKGFTGTREMDHHNFYYEINPAVKGIHAVIVDVSPHKPFQLIRVSLEITGYENAKSDYAVIDSILKDFDNMILGADPQQVHDIQNAEQAGILRNNKDGNKIAPSNPALAEAINRGILIKNVGQFLTSERSIPIA